MVNAIIEIASVIMTPTMNPREPDIIIGSEEGILYSESSLPAYASCSTSMIGVKTAGKNWTTGYNNSLLKDLSTQCLFDSNTNYDIHILHFTIHKSDIPVMLRLLVPSPALLMAETLISYISPGDSPDITIWLLLILAILTVWEDALPTSSE